MKFSLHIDKSREEEVIIYAHEDNSVFAQIKQMVIGDDLTLVGYKDDNIVMLNRNDVACFISSDDRVYALVGKNRYLIKKRLYQVAELLGRDYIRINQSCIANIRQIERFQASFGGSLEVVFSNGYKDYISRRELKNVKERIGIV